MMFDAIVALLDKSFWQQLTSTLLGASVGIPIGLWFDHRKTRRDELSREVTKREQAQQLRKAFERVIQRNRDLADEIAKTNQPERIVFGAFDRELFESTRTLKYELLDDFELCTTLDALGTAVGAVQCKIDTLRHVWSDGSVRSLTLRVDGKDVAGIKYYLDLLVPAIRDDCRTIGASCEGVLGQLGVR